MTLTLIGAWVIGFCLIGLLYAVGMVVNLRLFGLSIAVTGFYQYLMEVWTSGICLYVGPKVTNNSADNTNSLWVQISPCPVLVRFSWCLVGIGLGMYFTFKFVG